VFYFGLFGLIILIIPFVYIINFAIKKSSLSLEEVVLLSFTISGLLYGVSYNLPTYFFGIIGITLGIMEARSSSIKNISISENYKPDRKLIYSGK
jgi:hypothetical protein